MTGESKSVLHVASHQINVGDGALIGVIQDRLESVAGSSIAFREFDIVDLEPEYGGVSFDGVDPSSYSLILVGGGGTIDNRRTRAGSGMAFPMSGEEIRRSATPLAFVAVGYNLFGGTRLRHGEALADVLRACRERGFPFSVRNDGSLERLRAAVGAAADAVIEVPDPGFFVEADPDYVVPQFTDHRPRVLVQVAGDNPGFRFARVAGDLMGRIANRVPPTFWRGLTNRIADLVVWLVEEADAEVVLAPHITKDLAVTAAIIDRLPARVARKRVRVLGVPHPSRARQFFSAYAGSDLVIGMRGHSVICACGLRTPCIGLSTHPKVRGFMEKCDLEPWTVDYGRGFEERLRRLAAELLADPGEHLRRRDLATRDFGPRLDSFLEDCWRIAR